MTHSPLLLILDALAVARLTRLITVDAITAGLRARLAGRRPAVSRDLSGERIMIAARPRLAQFIACPWCVSPYLAAMILALQSLWPAGCLYLSAGAAFSLIAGLIAEHT